MTSSFPCLPGRALELTPSQDSGLRQDSDVQVDKITTLRRDQLTERSGHVDNRALIEIARLLMLILGIARYVPAVFFSRSPNSAFASTAVFRARLYLVFT